MKNWKTITAIILLSIAMVGAVYYIGYLKGKSTVLPTVISKIEVDFKPADYITNVTIADPTPIKVIEYVDREVLVYPEQPVDSMEVVKDYLRTRQYSLDFSTDSTGVFMADIDVHQNRITSASATIQPMYRTETITITQPVYLNKRFGVGVQLGYGYSFGENKFYPYLGVGISYNLFTF